MPSHVKRIAVIGAGPSGLAATKYLLAEKTFSRIIIFEQRGSVGGVWDFTPPSPTRNGLVNGISTKSPPSKAIDVVTANLPEFNTPMYEGLEANLPHTLMQFSDTPFSEGTQLFPTRENVMSYLQAYATDLMPMIKLNHQVVDVKPLGGDEYSEWEVKVRDLVQSDDKVEIFDAIVVANGHCDWPLLPDVEGLDTWSRMLPESLQHSVSYKNAKAYQDKIQKSPYHTNQPTTRDHPALVSLSPEKRTARFADGSIECDIDMIILCTGYAYCFPFLTSADPKINDQGIHALHPYQRIFDLKHPNLAFIETPEMIVPFPLAEAQAAVVARVWSGRLDLPSYEEMQKWCENMIRQQGAGRGFHALQPPSDLDYMKEMYNWSSKAKIMTSSNNIPVGKMPKYWDAEACWIRMAAAEMKKAFNARGEERSKVTNFEELGFRYKRN
ncbi:MAG: hypothetical protein Q9167_002697 [Letrouitia subvulpina]